MPTDTGGETIAERLTRLRAELTSVRATIERQNTNGASFGAQGTSITQIAIERAEARESKLQEEIRGLEARLAGGRRGIANLGSRSW